MFTALPIHTAVDVGQPQQAAYSSAEPFVDALPLGTAIPFTADHIPDPEWLRLQVRQLIREFLMPLCPEARRLPPSHSPDQMARREPYLVRSSVRPLTACVRARSRSSAWQ